MYSFRWKRGDREKEKTVFGKPTDTAGWTPLHNYSNERQITLFTAEPHHSVSFLVLFFFLVHECLPSIFSFLSISIGPSSWFKKTTVESHRVSLAAHTLTNKSRDGCAVDYVYDQVISVCCPSTEKSKRTRFSCSDEHITKKVNRENWGKCRRSVTSRPSKHDATAPAVRKAGPRVYFFPQNWKKSIDDGRYGFALQ